MAVEINVNVEVLDVDEFADSEYRLADIVEVNGPYITRPHNFASREDFIAAMHALNTLEDRLSISLDDDSDLDIVRAFIEHNGSGYWVNAADDVYGYEYHDSWEDYAGHIFDGLYEHDTPDIVGRYIDFEKWGNDLHHKVDAYEYEDGSVVIWQT